MIHYLLVIAYKQSVLIVNLSFDEICLNAVMKFTFVASEHSNRRKYSR